MLGTSDYHIESEVTVTYSVVHTRTPGRAPGAVWLGQQSYSIAIEV